MEVTRYRGFLFWAVVGLLVLTVRPACAEVIINSPSGGATVSGTVTVKAYVNQAWWSKLWVDGQGIATAAVGNVSFQWNSANVADGTYTLTVKGYPQGQTAANAAESITVTVNNHSSSSTSTIHFGTLPASASLPSDSWCAAHIPWEREMVPANAGTNGTIPDAGQLAAYAANGYTANYYDGKWAYARVDGHYTGTTDMIFRWAACKWGIDEDVVRAEATAEDWDWNQPDSHGDKRTSYSECVNGPFKSLWDFMCPSCCYQSWSIFQTKVYYDWPTWPMIHNSTAFGADFRMADQRACMDGDLAGYFVGRPTYNGHSYTKDVASGNLNTILWGCVGFHYSGNWYDGNSSNGALWYINVVKNYYYNKPWKTHWPTVNWPD